MKSIDAILAGYSLKQVCAEFERKLLIELLIYCDGNIDRAATQAEITRQGMIKKIDRHKLKEFNQELRNQKQPSRPDQQLSLDLLRIDLGLGRGFLYWSRKRLPTPYQKQFQFEEFSSFLQNQLPEKRARAPVTSSPIREERSESLDAWKDHPFFAKKAPQESEQPHNSLDNQPGNPHLKTFSQPFDAQPPSQNDS